MSIWKITGARGDGKAKRRYKKVAKLRGEINLERQRQIRMEYSGEYTLENKIK